MEDLDDSPSQQGHRPPRAREEALRMMQLIPKAASYAPPLGLPLRAGTGRSEWWILQGTFSCLASSSSPSPGSLGHPPPRPLSKCSPYSISSNPHNNLRGRPCYSAPSSEEETEAQKS